MFFKRWFRAAHHALTAPGPAPAPDEELERPSLDEDRYWPAIYVMAVVLAGVWIYFAIEGYRAYQAVRGAQ